MRLKLVSPIGRCGSATNCLLQFLWNQVGKVGMKDFDITSIPFIRDGWFYEESFTFPGQKVGYEVEEILVWETTPYQTILLFQSKSYGKVLVLDGIVQCTERDEFAYHEMMAHIPLSCHPSPKKVLVIGGGDGGILRQILKHEEVEEVTLCEIDKRVIEVCQEHMPKHASCLTHPKVRLQIGDGIAFMSAQKNCFDVIFTDSSDPIGPGEALFEKPYYQLIYDSLRNGGVSCSQGESIWLDLDLISGIVKFSQTIFPVVQYALTSVPTYTSGAMGFILCSKSPLLSLSSPRRNMKSIEDTCLFYNKALHEAAFALPSFVNRQLLLKHVALEK